MALMLITKFNDDLDDKTSEEFALSERLYMYILIGIKIFIAIIVIFEILLSLVFLWKA